MNRISFLAFVGIYASSYNANIAYRLTGGVSVAKYREMRLNFAVERQWLTEVQHDKFHSAYIIGMCAYS
jgi:hypothetical protein